jgi:hypothetical protein
MAHFGQNYTSVRKKRKLATLPPLDDVRLVTDVALHQEIGAELLPGERSRGASLAERAPVAAGIETKFQRGEKATPFMRALYFP